MTNTIVDRFVALLALVTVVVLLYVLGGALVGIAATPFYRLSILLVVELIVGAIVWLAGAAAAFFCAVVAFGN